MAAYSSSPGCGGKTERAKLRDGLLGTLVDIDPRADARIPQDAYGLGRLAERVFVELRHPLVVDPDLERVARLGVIRGQRGHDAGQLAHARRSRRAGDRAGRRAGTREQQAECQKPFHAEFTLQGRFQAPARPAARAGQPTIPTVTRKTAPVKEAPRENDTADDGGRAGRGLYSLEHPLARGPSGSRSHVASAP